MSDGNRYKALDPGLGIGFWHSGAVGDLNNDGLADLLAVTTSKGSNTIAIQQKDGTLVRPNYHWASLRNDKLVLLSTQGEDQGKSNFYKGYAVMLVSVSKRQIDKPKTIESNKNAKWFPWIYSCDLNDNLKDEVFLWPKRAG